MEEIEFLYHYTSIQSLALILKNRSIKFNNLLNVDDPEEAETEDLGKAGRHCLVSCWTANKEDVIPMWNLYTPDMKGVRIGMRKYPFKEYVYRKGEMHFVADTPSYINYDSAYAKTVNILPKSPLFEKVIYTDREELLKPKIVTKTENDINVSFENIGRCKRKYWSFQQEYRYIIRTAPWSMKELENVKSPEGNLRLFNRVLDENNTQFCKEIFLDLADDAFANMEILLAPKASEPEFIIVQALLDKYCPNNHIKIGKSRIRIT